MTSIRIAFASALAIGALFAGGSAPAAHNTRQAARHAVAAAVVPLKASPVLCCGPGV